MYDLTHVYERLSRRYSKSDVPLLCKAMHAAIRGLNSLADLEMLASFVDKHFGDGVENRNTALLDVVHFEEEVLRQKITWREKYGGAISGWLEPKSNKNKRLLYRPNRGRDAAAAGGDPGGSGGGAAAAETDGSSGDAKPVSDKGPVKAEGEVSVVGTVGAAAAVGKGEPTADDQKTIEIGKPRPDERSESSTAASVAQNEPPPNEPPPNESPDVGENKPADESANLNETITIERAKEDDVLNKK
jgi:hypothetical protein